MNTQKLKIEELGVPERKLLLTALDLNMKTLRCFYCKKRQTIKGCAIMPGLNKKELTRILCVSPFCLSTYLSDYEDTPEIKSHEVKRE